MRHILVLIFILASSLFAEAQVKPQKNQQAEMQQAVDEMKKEIRRLEDEIKKKTDPEEAASLKRELGSLRSMLSMFEKPGKPVTKPSTSAPLKSQSVKNTPSPITPVILKQPYSIPTAEQATDRLLWYKGKKINDSTLVTVKGMVVQFNKNNKKRSVVKIQPLKKADPFDSLVVEFTKTEKRKEELIDKFDKMKNGFLFYTELKTTLALYDDLAERMGSILKNTIDLPEMPLPAANEQEAPSPLPAAKGPSANYGFIDTLPGTKKDEWTEKLQAMEQQMKLAEQLFQQLPPVHSFPAPPKHEPGMCSYCDPNTIKTQRLQDSVWLGQYQGKEEEIEAMVLGVERQRALMGIQSDDRELLSKLLERGVAKATILYEKYGNEFRSSKIVMQVIVGLERQIQLLGMAEGIPFNGMQMLMQKLDKYEEYLEEQIQAKNHDFVLNISSHLGYIRQKTLLGSFENPGAAADEMIQQWLRYNRFELIVESDFIVEKRNEDGELQFKATGALAMKEKIYSMFIPDSCNYKILPYTLDYTSASINDISISMSVRSGTKTIKDENGKLADYPYTGPSTYLLAFPDASIDFCNHDQSDSIWLHTFTGEEGITISTDHLISTTNNSYQLDFLTMVNLVFVTNDLPQNEQNFETVSQDLFNTMGGFQSTDAGGSKLEKMKRQYEGKNQMDKHRKEIQKLVNNQETVIIFSADNKQTVVTDKFIDTKRKLENEGLELTRGLIHLKIIHTAVK